MSEPVLELIDATVVKEDRRILDRLTLTIHAGEHTAIVGPNGAGKSFLTKLLSHEERPLVPEDGSSPIRVFGSDTWDVFDLRSQLGIVSAEMHHRFVSGNSEGRVRGEAAVLSGFLASQGILRYGSITPRCGSAPPTPSRSWEPRTWQGAGWMRCRVARRAVCCWPARW